MKNAGYPRVAAGAAPRAFPQSRPCRDLETLKPDQCAQHRAKGADHETLLSFFADPGFARRLYDSEAGQGTPIRFDSWQHGVGVTDPVTGQIDRRWYRRFNPDGQAGWTPSAWVKGDASYSTP